MSKTVEIILLFLALLCFLIVAFGGDRVPPRVNLLALGLGFWVLVPLGVLVLG